MLLEVQTPILPPEVIGALVTTFLGMIFRWFEKKVLKTDYEKKVNSEKQRTEAVASLALKYGAKPYELEQATSNHV